MDYFGGPRPKIVHKTRARISADSLAVGEKIGIPADERIAGSLPAGGKGTAGSLPAGGEYRRDSEEIPPEGAAGKYAENTHPRIAFRRGCAFST